jgi:cytochrome c
MKTVLTASMLALGVLFSGAVLANPDLAKAKCGKCHEMDKKKKGPPYKETAAKYKGKADAEATILKAISDPKGDHPELEGVKPDEVKTVVQWILKQ